MCTLHVILELYSLRSNSLYLSFYIIKTYDYDLHKISPTLQQKGKIDHARVIRIISGRKRIMTKDEFAKYIDHTNLSPKATRSDIKTLCEDALRYNFAAVCVNPCRVGFAASFLEGSSVKVASVVGFPWATFTEAKLETKYALRSGASEIDMVITSEP